MIRGSAQQQPDPSYLHHISFWAEDRPINEAITGLHFITQLPGLSGFRTGDGWQAGVLPGACPCSLQRPPSQSRITHHEDNADRMFLMKRVLLLQIR